MDKNRFLEELRRTEKENWELPHSLMIDEDARMKLRKKIDEHFQSPKLQLCFKVMNRHGFCYKIWFVKDSESDWVINFHEECDGTYLVKVYQCDESLTVHKEMERKDEIIERMKTVVGATNYSLLLRNSEHIAWYVLTSVWVSYQICQEFSQLKRALEPDQRAENLINEPPQEFLQGHVRRKVFDDLSYDKECVQNAVENEILDGNYNPFRVIVIGPTGVGKSTIINHLYNKEVCNIGQDSATRETDKVASTHGIYFNTRKMSHKGGKLASSVKRVNIFDTIGLCDGQLTDSENIEYIKSYLEPRIEKLDKVVVVFSVESKSESHTEAMKACLYALNYGDNKENFVFVLSQCDLFPQDQKENEEQLYKMVNKITDGNMPSPSNLKRQTVIISKLNQKKLSDELRTKLRELKRKIFSDVKDKLIIPSRKRLENEINLWRTKGHTLETVRSSVDERQIQDLSTTLHLCYTENVFTGGQLFKVYFITDKKISIKLKTGRGSRLEIIDENKAENEYHTEMKLYKTRAVEERISHVKGFSNVSLAFRNSEHVCRYIISGVWVSYQMTRGGVLRNIFEPHWTEQSEEKKLLNVLPSSLDYKKDPATMKTIFEEEDSEHCISYKSRHNFLEKSDSTWYNVVFVGASGAGKLPLINHLFNQEVLPNKKPLTRNCRYICGSYQNKKVCVVDTIGLNGEDLDSDQIININIDSLEANLSHIDKIVIIASRRIELEHKKSIGKISRALGLDKNSNNCVFIYNNSSSSVTDGKRESNIEYFLKEIGINRKERESKDLSLTLTKDLTFQEAKNQLEDYRRAVLTSNSGRINIVNKKDSGEMRTVEDANIDQNTSDRAETDGWNLPEKSPIVQSTTNSLNQNLSGVVNQAHSIRDINANNVNIYQNSNFFLGFFLVSIFLLLLSVFYVTGGARDEMKD